MTLPTRLSDAADTPEDAMDKKLHVWARKVAENIKSPDKRQLRFNDIVRTAIRFYPNDMMDGVTELVQSCDKDDLTLYAAKSPMWKSLQDNYGWMFPEPSSPEVV